jgi:hypothetical protein
MMYKMILVYDTYKEYIIVYGVMYKPWVFCSTLMNHFVSYICIQYKK